MDDLKLVMHGIAVKKYATVEEVSVITGLCPETVFSLATEAVSKERASEANGKYLLTPIGQVALASEYSRYYSGLRKDQEFLIAYEEFEQVNIQLKKTITDWQIIEISGQAVPNDHTDQKYDASIIDRLGAIHDKVEMVLERLSKKEERLRRYLDLLLSALEKAEDGEIEWISDATIASYHTVWFELHEDLLRIVGREREEQ